MKRSALFLGLLATSFACDSASNDGMPSSETLPGGGGQAAIPGSAGANGAQPPAGGTTDGPVTGGNTGGATGGATGSGATGGATGPSGPTGGAMGPSGGAGTSPGGAGGASGTAGTSGGGTTAGGASNGGAVGQDAGAGGGAEAGSGGVAGQGGSQAAGAGGESGTPMSSCIGEEFPTADPTKAGPFQVTSEKNVGPLAGVVPDPIYGNEQQRFNVYRPANMGDSGYCHPILIWANGYRDNPEQNPPECVVDAASNQWCGQYSPLLNHLASHGFVVVAPLSTATAEGDPLPTLAGLDWILEEAEAPESQYYQRLDTTAIGQLGHSYGGMSTCMSASDPRYKALATICGTRALEGVHTPMLFFCGGMDSTVNCSGVKDVFLTVTDQPAFFLNERGADHGSWVYEGPGGVSLSASAAWFRVHLMNDTANRKFFYGSGCTFCTDNRVEAEQNSLMAQ